MAPGSDGRSLSSDAGAAGAFLDLLTGHGVDFALLTGEAHLARGRMTGADVDLVVDRAWTRVLAAVRGAMSASDLFPATVVPNGPGSTTVVVLSGDATTGAHLDLHHDPQGRGALGLRTGAMLQGRHEGARWPAASAQDACLYLLRKRMVYGPESEVVRARDAVLETWESSKELQERLALLFRSDASQAMADLVLRSDAAARPVARLLVERWGKRARWVLRPPGFWVEMHGDPHDVESAATDLAERFGWVLYTAVVHSPSRGARRWALWLRRILPRRWRPAVTFTWGVPASHPEPDLRLSCGQVDTNTMARRVVEALASRY